MVDVQQGPQYDSYLEVHPMGLKQSLGFIQYGSGSIPDHTAIADVSTSSTPMWPCLAWEPPQAGTVSTLATGHVQAFPLGPSEWINMQDAYTPPWSPFSIVHVAPPLPLTHIPPPYQSSHYRQQQQYSPHPATATVSPASSQAASLIGVSFEEVPDLSSMRGNSTLPRTPVVAPGLSSMARPCESPADELSVFRPKEVTGGSLNNHRWQR